MKVQQQIAILSPCSKQRVVQIYWSLNVHFQSSGCGTTVSALWWTPITH